MTALRVLIARLLARPTKGGGEVRLNEEIEAHLELLTDEYLRRGLSRDEARAAARRAFGGVEQVKEAYREQRGLPLVDALGQDLRYAGRMLRRDPAFTMVAILSLGLGIGAATAIFSVFNAVMLRPLSVPEPQQLVILEPRHQAGRWILFNPIFEELRRQQQTLSGMFAVNDERYLKVTFDGDVAPTYVRASFVSGSYFSVLGLSPLRGRLLTEADDELFGAPGQAGCSAVVSYSFWTRRFQADPTVVGRSLRAREADCTIVGVAPASFESHQSGYAPDVWLPLRPLTDRKLLASRSMAFFSGVMGRLRPGVTLRQAEAELTAMYQRIPQGEPPRGVRAANPADFRIALIPSAQGLDGLRRRFSEPLGIVLAVVGVVLLIAALNVATLLLARGAARLPELATRAALGAGRGRLIRQLCTEGGLVAVLGGVVGAALAWLVTPALGALVSGTLDTAADRRVIAVAVGATALAAVLAGVLPAVRLGRATLQAGLGSEGRSATPQRGGHRLTRMLVAAQLALSLLLISASGLLLRTMVRISGIDPGFRPDHVALLDVRDETPGWSWSTPDTIEQKAHRAAIYRAAEERLSGLPGVRAASLSWLGLFSANDLWLALIDADQPDQRSEGRVDYVSARYFDAVGMQILRGRGFDDPDREGAERIAVVNETLARERFRGDALGRRLALNYTGEQTRPFKIVGIVRDSKYNDLREEQVEPMMWMPLAQAPFRITSVALRVEPGFESAVARQAEAALTSVDPHLMVRRTTTLSAQVAQRTSRERLLLGLASAFGGLAMLLAAMGLYGTLAYAVACRTREIGVRLALGAPRATVLGMVLSDAMTLVATALVVGVPLALAAGSSLRAFLFGVTPQDPASLCAACALLAAAALLAAYVPARRAAAVDPITALRCE
jgi:predicted permease